MIKNCSLLIPRPPYKEVQATGETSALKREHLAFQKMKFRNLFQFLWLFLPSLIRIRIRIRNKTLVFARWFNKFLFDDKFKMNHCLSSVLRRSFQKASSELLRIQTHKKTVSDPVMFQLVACTMPIQPFFVLIQNQTEKFITHTTAWIFERRGGRD